MKGAEARRERNRLEMRQAVLDSAQKTVAQGGIESLTIRGIAKDVGYSPAAIYEYFRSKEDIVHSLYFEGSGGLSQAMANCAISIPEGTDVFTVMRELAQVFRDVALANREMYRLVFGVLKQPDEVKLISDDSPMNAFQILYEAVQRGLKEGDLIDADPVEIAVSCWSIAHGFVSLEITDHFELVAQGPGDPIEARNALYGATLNALMRGWASEQGRSKLSS